ncbi:hypothetical protein GGD63_007209 [Bradyrhizobium sp. cir1]|uniref:hypothetical protein n=1 Tax=Bradyrhizobium sp. cir1 TaxID=1445730 RepID=UPI0016068B15|nr:hypothetical protein [Bradyrhizobium sp. cir1]MBB4374379.1 hypothetical protein [Bradyrhizobium sp. cir1]
MDKKKDIGWRQARAGSVCMVLIAPRHEVLICHIAVLMCQAQGARLDSIDPGRFEIAGLLSIASATIVGLLAECVELLVWFSASTE